jgi:hypothetical protein
MARKRKNLQHLEYNSQEYWNRLLAQEGLSVDKGKDPRLVYIGGSNEVDLLQEELSQKQTGRVEPKDRQP